MLPAELRSTVNDADLERSAVQKMSEAESSNSLFKEDSFAERAFTHRLRRTIEQEREAAKRARLVPSSQQSSASAPFDGGPSPASLAVASSPPPPIETTLPQKRALATKTEPTGKSRSTATTTVATATTAAAVSPPTTTAAALARGDSIEETAEELERRRELEARLEQERLERTKRKAAASKPGGKKGFL